MDKIDAYEARKSSSLYVWAVRYLCLEVYLVTVLNLKLDDRRATSCLHWFHLFYAAGEYCAILKRQIF